MKKMASKKNIFIVAALVIAGGLILAALEITQVTDLYKKPENRKQQNQASDSATTSNDQSKIDETPATEQDNQSINQKKETDPKANPENEPVQASSKIQAVLNRTDIQDDKVLVRATVFGATSGSCQAEFAKDSDGTKVLSTKVEVQQQGAGYYTCKPINLPTTSLSKGAWSVSVMLESGGQSAKSQSMTIEVP